MCLTYLRKHYCSNETESAWCLWSVVSREQSYGRSWPCGLAVSHRTAKTMCLHGPHTAPQTTWDTAAPLNQQGLWQSGVLMVQGHVRACKLQIFCLHRCYQIFKMSLNDAVHAICISVNMSHEQLTSQKCNWACWHEPQRKAVAKSSFSACICST